MKRISLQLLKKISSQLQKNVLTAIKKFSLPIFFFFLPGHSIKWQDLPEIKIILMQKKEAF